MSQIAILRIPFFFFFFLGVDPIIWEQAKVDNPDPDK